MEREMGESGEFNASWRSATLRREIISRCVSRVNGSCVIVMNLSNRKSGGQRVISQMRSRCPSAAIIFLAFAMCTVFGREQSSRSCMTMGKVGQTSSIRFTGLLIVQRSRRLRRRGNPNTRILHLWETCTSVYRASSCFESTLSIRSTSYKVHRLSPYRS